jgi:putative addiction module component (TIGR02574 family)
VIDRYDRKGESDTEEQPFSAEWLAEIERRVEAYRSGKEPTIPWPEVRDAALARIRQSA